MRRCDVEGLLLGRCSQYAVPGEDLCYYHNKLRDGYLEPPGDEGFFWSGEEPELPAVFAELSYLQSNHPEFAKLVPTGGITLEPVSAAR